MSTRKLRVASIPRSSQPNGILKLLEQYRREQYRRAGLDRPFFDAGWACRHLLDLLPNRDREWIATRAQGRLWVPRDTTTPDTKYNR